LTSCIAVNFSGFSVAQTHVHFYLEDFNILFPELQQVQIFGGYMLSCSKNPPHFFRHISFSVVM